MTDVIADNEKISVYPNPAVASFELTVPETLTGEQAYIFDISGKPVRNFTVGDIKTTVSTAGMTSGIYFVKVGNNTEKIVVK